MAVQVGDHSLNPTSVFSNIVPSFSTGRLLKTYYHSAFTERERHVFYTPTRRTRGQPDLHGAWDTRKEPNGNGPYTIIVRAVDYWGNVGCLTTEVKLKNKNIGYGDPEKGLL